MCRTCRIISESDRQQECTTDLVLMEDRGYLHAYHDDAERVAIALGDPVTTSGRWNTVPAWFGHAERERIAQRLTDAGIPHVIVPTHDIY